MYPEDSNASHSCVHSVLIPSWLGNAAPKIPSQACYSQAESTFVFVDQLPLTEVTFLSAVTLGSAPPPTLHKTQKSFPSLPQDGVQFSLTPLQMKQELGCTVD